jgi:aspartyl-tRNA(Asn)/glutamyl-tRNA(Gln) amidotransferase subunit C
MLSREEVLKIAKLARLELTEDEVALYQKNLDRVLEYVHELNSVPTPKDAFVRHVPKDSVAFREDRALPFAAAAQLVELAPASEDGSFLLPPVMEQE